MLRHFDRENAFLEDAFALDDQIVRPLEPVEMHVPIHPVDSDAMAALQSRSFGPCESLPHLSSVTKPSAISAAELALQLVPASAIRFPQFGRRAIRASFCA